MSRVLGSAIYNNNVAVRLDDDTYNYLKEISEERGEKISIVIREILQEQIKK